MVSGGEDGYVCLWSSLKKKPVCSLPEAHGRDSWIICVATCLYTDLFASGSNNGEIQVQSLQDYCFLSHIFLVRRFIRWKQI